MLTSAMLREVELWSTRVRYLAISRLGNIEDPRPDWLAGTCDGTGCIDNRSVIKN